MYGNRSPEDPRRIIRNYIAIKDALPLTAETLPRMDHESHQDTKKFHDDQIEKLQRDYQRIQDRIDAMYLDKLDKLIDAPFFQLRAAEWRNDQSRITTEIEAHRTANKHYVDEGVKLLDLANRAYLLFDRQPPREKRKLLDFVLSNCSWKNGELMAHYREPFDLLAGAVIADHAMIAAAHQEVAKNENWLLG